MGLVLFGLGENILVLDIIDQEVYFSGSEIIHYFSTHESGATFSKQMTEISCIRRWANVGSLLGRRRKKSTLAQRLMFAGYVI